MILVSGANGYLGSRVVKKLLAENETEVLALASSTDKLKQMGFEENRKLRLMSNDDFLNGGTMHIDGVVHLAFARANRTECEIAGSLVFTRQLFMKLLEDGADNICYISSQSVYGNTDTIRTEETTPSPSSLYSLAKYAGEQLLETCFSERNHTSIRLDSVIQSQRLVYALMKQAAESGIMRLEGGKQVFSYIDVDDAVNGIVCLIKKSDTPWKKVYNLGLNRSRITLVQLAEKICSIFKKNGREVSYTLTEKDIAIWSGMDSSSFISDMNWSPHFGMDDMLERLFYEVNEAL